MIFLAKVLFLGGCLILQVRAVDGTIQLDIQRNENVQRAQLERRAKAVSAPLGNDESLGLYSINVSVGTPEQQLTVQIDTGSADLWLPSSDASLCSTSGGCPGGSFEASASSTFDDIEPGEFDISYVDGSGSSGDYFLDTVHIGGSELKKFQMGLANKTTISYGILGIGYESSEAATGVGNGDTYPNLPAAMVTQGLIKSPAYSLWLNDLDASTGSILFGGIDTKKFSGDLIAVDISPAQNSDGSTSYTTFTIALTSVSATSSSGTDQLTGSSYAEAVILDSGTTITLLPNNVASKIYEELGATVDKKVGAVVVPCKLANNGGTINFGFGGDGGPVIKIDMSEIVLPLYLSNGQAPTYSNGDTACQLGMQAAGELPVLFGDTFLRSAYTVYDLANNQIALAQTEFNTTESNVVAFSSSGAPIPSAKTIGQDAESSVTQTMTGHPKATSASAASVTSDTTALSAAGGFTGTATSTSTHKSGASRGQRSDLDTFSVFLTLTLMWIGVGGSLVWL